jgi:small subunit ribosomal protein S21
LIDAEMNGQKTPRDGLLAAKLLQARTLGGRLRVNRSGGRPGYSGTSTETLGTPTREERRVQVLVRDNNVDQALKALKKKMQREGIFREMKLRGHYEKPSEKKAREKAEAIRRARKLARKRAQREGLIPGKPKPAARPGR